MQNIKVGIDLDNTIINYENSFKKYLKKNKIFLNKVDKSKFKYIANNNSKFINWTAAQEEIYGYYIFYAKPFKYFKEFEKFAKKNKIKLFIVSHKTKYSQFSKKYNLRLEANKWIKKNIKLKMYKIFYVNTINEKIEIIKKNKLNYFIDDLIEIFLKKNFPSKTNKIFFSNHKTLTILSIKTWKGIKNEIKKKENYK